MITFTKGDQHITATYNNIWDGFSAVVLWVDGWDLDGWDGKPGGGKYRAPCSANNNFYDNMVLWPTYVTIDIGNKIVAFHMILLW